MANEQSETQSYEQMIRSTNESLTERSHAKHFVIPSGRPCAEATGGERPVDFVFVIYCNHSMTQDDKPQMLHNELQTILAAAKARCAGVLRDRGLGIEGRFEGTMFGPSYRSYLVDEGIMDGPDDKRLVGIPQQRSAGAAAIIDLARYYNWREGAARYIFVMGDWWLGNVEVDGQELSRTPAMKLAIKTAQEEGVKVFTYCADSSSTDDGESKRAQYTQTAAETGGQSYTAPVENIRDFQAALEAIICAEVDQTGCATFQVPELRPCFELRWGDGAKDQIETEDVEVLCLMASNPYDNVVLKDVTIVLSVLSQNGNQIPDLPDGTAAVSVTPSEFICFGDLPPCQNGKHSKIAREVVLVSRLSNAGDYTLDINYCYSAEFTLQDSDRFKLGLVES